MVETKKPGLAKSELRDLLALVPGLRSLSCGSLWSNYDEEADVLYINLKQGIGATDSELTDDDIIIRYEGDSIIGVTILNASKR